MSNTAGERTNKNQRRDAARERARELREEQQKKSKRNRLFIQSGVVLGILGVLTVITLVILGSRGPGGPGPANMASDGLVIGAGFEAQTTPPLAEDADPVATTPSDDPDVVDIRIYVDYLCPYCGLFEENYGDTLNGWLQSGDITLEIHPVATLNHLSLGSAYPTRAANAFACVANYSPNDAWNFHRALFADQPAEQTAGLTDEQIIGIAESVNPQYMTQIETCITEQTFRGWVGDATARARDANPLPGTESALFQGTPTVIVNGVQWTDGELLPFIAEQQQLKRAAADALATETETETEG